MECVLIVDDDVNLLHGLRRQLQRFFTVHTAQGSAEAIQRCGEKVDYRVIVSDMQMPGMNGVQFFEQVSRMIPQSIRIMLTGNADQRTAVDAVNTGRIFRFLNKPCTAEDLKSAIEAGLEQYRLIHAEKELLSKTLVGSVKILTDVLSLMNPIAFGRATRVKKVAKAAGERLGLTNLWELELAAMLAQVGCVALPAELLARYHRGETLSPAELQLLKDHPRVGATLIGNIARLKGVAEIVAHQEGTNEEIGAANLTPPRTRAVHILKVTSHLDRWLSGGVSRSVAIAKMKEAPQEYDLEVVEAVRDVLAIDDFDATQDRVPVRVAIRNLRDGMILAEDIATARGTILVGQGQLVSESMRFHLENDLKVTPLEGTVLVYAS